MSKLFENYAHEKCQQFFYSLPINVISLFLCTSCSQYYSTKTPWLRGLRKDVLKMEELKTLEKMKPSLYSKGGISARQTEGGKQKMASQKENVTWSLHEDRGTWVVRTRLYDEVTGKTVNKSKSTGVKVSEKKADRRKAERMATELVKQMLEKQAENKYSGDVAFEVYVNAWLDNKDITVHGNTAKSYRDYARVHIIPALGKIAVKDITWRHLQAFCDKLAKDHSSASVKKYFLVIRGALDDAVRDGVISRNPVDSVKLPKVIKSEKSRALTGEEVTKVLAAAERAGEPLRAAVILGLYYGLRRSEVCGLRWIDIDFEKGVMQIRHTITQNGTLTIEEDHTKSSGSRRAITLIGKTVPYLKELRKRQFKSGVPLDKVVAWPDGHYLRADGIGRMFQRMIVPLDIGAVRFHDLRHTAATLLAKKCLSPNELKTFMGHDDVSVTLGVYVHTDKNGTENASKMMDEIFGELDSCSEKCSEQTVIALGL